MSKIKIVVLIIVGLMVILSGCKMLDEIANRQNGTSYEIEDELQDSSNSDQSQESSNEEVDNSSNGNSDSSEDTSSSNIHIVSSTTVKTTSGKRITINKTDNGITVSGQEGKIILLEMYGWNCPHCIASISGYNKLKKKYPDDIYIVTFESYGTIGNTQLKEYKKNYNLEYDTVAKENAGKVPAYVYDLTGYKVETIGVPALMIFGKDGDLVEYIPPQDLPYSYVDSIIQGLL